MATKKPTAAQLAARKLFAARVKAGEFAGAGKRKKNPLTRVKVNSPPQRPRGNSDTPSARLKKRRRSTQKAPEGYYANPVAPMDRRGKQERHEFVYLVEFWWPEAGAWQVTAGFDTYEYAEKFAYAFAKDFPNRKIRVVDNFA